MDLILPLSPVQQGAVLGLLLSLGVVFSVQICCCRRANPASQVNLADEDGDSNADEKKQKKVYSKPSWAPPKTQPKKVSAPAPAPALAPAPPPPTRPPPKQPQTMSEHASSSFKQSTSVRQKITAHFLDEDAISEYFFCFPCRQLSFLTDRPEPKSGAQSNRLLRTLTHQGCISAICFGDGDLMATAAEDNTLRVWRDYQTFPSNLTLDLKLDCATALFFFDEKTIVFAGEEV